MRVHNHLSQVLAHCPSSHSSRHSELQQPDFETTDAFACWRVRACQLSDRVAEQGQTHHPRQTPTTLGLDARRWCCNKSLAVLSTPALIPPPDMHKQLRCLGEWKVCFSSELTCRMHSTTRASQWLRGEGSLSQPGNRDQTLKKLVRARTFFSEAAYQERIKRHMRN